MCGTIYFSLQSSNTLNYRREELASLYTVPLSAVNGLSRLTKLTTSKEAGMADSIKKFSNRSITFESNRTADLNSNRISKLRRSLHYTLLYLISKYVHVIGRHGVTWRSLNLAISLTRQYCLHLFTSIVPPRINIASMSSLIFLNNS